MEFKDQIKEIRKKEGLTQEELALKLSVTRQAVSNWETGKNLPDIEILINISNVFNISLDQLIKGDNMEKKLIKDGSDTRRARYNMVMVIIGTFLLCIGVMMIVIKGLSVEYIDAEGFLHVLWFSVFCGRRHQLCYGNFQEMSDYIKLWEYVAESKEDTLKHLKIQKR